MCGKRPVRIRNDAAHSSAKIRQLALPIGRRLKQRHQQNTTSVRQVSELRHEAGADDDIERLRSDESLQLRKPRSNGRPAPNAR